MVVLSVNAGSSSLKVSVFDRNDPALARASFAVEDIEPTSHATQTAVKQVQQWLQDKLSLSIKDVEAIGHRVVHGGEKYDSAVRITPDVRTYLESITPLAPNHMPSALATISAFTDEYPTAQHVACFDTSFFHAVPEVAKIFPLPLSLQKESGIRRYGFHGLAYAGLLDSFRQHEGETAYRGRVILAHLGSGASVAAIKDGQPLDMSMGFTPVSGIMMSTRSGDLEPGVMTYLATEKGMSSQDISTLLSHQSGLLGVSELTADMHVLLNSQQDNPQAALAIELFCYKIKKMIGAYTAVLGGVDSIIFSGGIGERSAEIRRGICQGLAYLGIELEDSRNNSSERLISADTSRVGIHVIPAREEYSIITQTIQVINKGTQ
jgi:acetate kinase